MKSRLLPLPAVLAALLALGHALAYAALQGRYAIDDAYISFRYAQNLARGLGLVFNAGERVEGYTNFGWVMLLALASRLGLDLPLVSRLANLLLAAGLVAFALRFLAECPRRSRRPVLAMALAGTALAADGVLARWAQDGMETLLFTLLVFAGAALSAPVEPEEGAVVLPSPWRGALAFALAALVRPEGALLAAVALLWSFFAGVREDWRGAFRRAVVGGAVFAAVWLPWFLWRWRYYGALLPNTFYAKVGTGGAQVLRGAHYLVYFFVGERWPWLLLSLACLLALPRPRLVPWQRLFLWIAAVDLLYVLLVGGDWMGAGRFLLPILPLLYLAAAEWTALALENPSRRWPARLAVPALLVAQLVLTSWRGEARNVRRERSYLESRAAIGQWLRQHAAPGDRLLTGEIGQLGWDSGLYTLDLFGLTDPRIAHLRVATMGRGKPGHEKFDLAYSLGQRPTWITMPFIVPLWRTRPAAFPILAEYEPVTLPTPPPIPSYGAFLHRRAAGSYGINP
ncbi:MAG TPA: hypothetical protein VFE33_30010 [Thermoanaerobaculia bacterium]|nr:hypothetical protein [Thermoanaerobaculia bacterium]